MKRSAFIALILAVAAIVAACPAFAFSKPVLDMTIGKATAIDGNPNGGGLSVSFTPLWAAGDRTRFGLSAFADDIGTQQVALADRTNQLDLGTVAERHRMTWGLAWRADRDLVQRKRWVAGVTGLAGWWRVQDDVRGTFLDAASAVGYAVGLEARRTVAARHAFGVATRYQVLTSDRHAGFRRVDHYATAAIEWRWTVDARH